MARRPIERTLRWLLRGAGIMAFAWVLHRADLRGAFPIIAAAGPVLVLALLPFFAGTSAYRNHAGALRTRAHGGMP